MLDVTATILTLTTGAVIGSLWLLDHLDLVPTSTLRTFLARIALVVVVLVMFTVPTAYQNGLAWLVERKTDDVLERIQPMLDELTEPPTSAPDDIASQP